MPENDSPLGRLLAMALRGSAPFGAGMLAEPIASRGLAGLLGQQSFAGRMAAMPQPQPADTARGMLSADFGRGIRPDDPRAELAMALSTATPRGSLPGWANNGPNRPFHQQNFPYTQYVRVTTPAGPMTEAQTWVDAVRGLNQGHALSRARYNWEGAAIEPITPSQARMLDPSIVD